MVNVIPLFTVSVPVTCAFSVASIVMFVSKACALVLNIPPFLKLPLNSAVGVIVPAAFHALLGAVHLPLLFVGCA